jgi:glutathione S-transferase
MGCSGSKGQGGGSSDGRLGLGKAGEVVIFGDYFNADTRSIISILHVSGIKYSFQSVDTLRGEHQEESYLHKNKAGTIPMLICGEDKVLGGGNVFPMYLRGQFEKVRDHLYKDSDKAQIDNLLNWYYARMAVETQRLIRLIVPPKVNGSKITSAKDHESMKEDQINLIFAESGSILNALENRLKNTLYMVSNELTVADIYIYSEISTVLAILDDHHTQEIEQKFDRLSKWHTTMSQIPQIKDCDELMKDLVHKFNLKEKHNYN